MPVILAHGALGVWDEIIYVSIAAIFVGFMGVSWLRSRNQPEEDEAAAHDEKNTPDRFKLD